MKSLKSGKREADIAKRLRQARESLGITHQDCAEQIGVPRTTLVNYELARTPLRFDVALRFCRQLIISEEWLATGRYDAMADAVQKLPALKGEHLTSLHSVFFRQCMDLLSEPECNRIPVGTLFSVAYDEHLAARYRELAQHFTYRPRIVFTDADGPRLAVNLLTAMLERYSKMLTNEAHRLKADAKGAQRQYFRAIYECQDIVFRRFMGFATPKLPAFWKVIAIDPAAGIGPLHADDDLRQARIPGEVEVALKE